MLLLVADFNLALLLEVLVLAGTRYFLIFDVVSFGLRFKISSWFGCLNDFYFVVRRLVNYFLSLSQVLEIILPRTWIRVDFMTCYSGLSGVERCLLERLDLKINEQIGSVILPRPHFKRVIWDERRILIAFCYKCH